MNRQSGPSIILSFLTVCFFAIILFPGNSRRAPTFLANPLLGTDRSGRPSAEVSPTKNSTTETHVKPSLNSRTITRRSLTDSRSDETANNAKRSGFVVETNSNLISPIATKTIQPKSVSPTNPIETPPSMSRGGSATSQNLSSSSLLKTNVHAPRVASKESTRSYPYTWSMVPRERRAENSDRPR